MAERNPDVDEVFAQQTDWRAEQDHLREILLGFDELSEERKWWQPCYVFEGANVAIIGAFKRYCSLGFFKGSLLADPSGVLEAPGEHSQSSRQVKFTSVEEIEAQEAVLRSLIEAAIEVERAGLQVEFKGTEECPVPAELDERFAADPAYRAAFEALTPGRQRGYLLHFAGAKQAKTRAARIERARERIEAGKGFNER